MKKTILTTVVLLATLSHAYGQEGLQPQTKLQNIAENSKKGTKSLHWVYIILNNLLNTTLLE